MSWRDFLYFSKGERRGLIVLLCLVTIAGILMIWVKKSDAPQNVAVERQSASFEPSRTTSAHVATPASFGSDESTKNTDGGKKMFPKETSSLRQKRDAASSEKQTVQNTTASGNQSESKTIVSGNEAPQESNAFGTVPSSSGTIQPSSEQTENTSSFGELADNVGVGKDADKGIAGGAGRRESVSERVQRLTSYGRSSYPRTEKFAKGTVVELNMADTIVLKKVPGIGSSFAKRIVGYRALLGGYYSVTQLNEVYGIDEDKYNTLAPWFTVDLSLIIRLPVNTLSQDSLRRHPYIDYGQAKVITQLRRQKGKLTGWENLQLLDEFTDGDKIRLMPYLSFE
jgi:DNA uptake protein ComE-like DNA-binding protein